MSRRPGYFMKLKGCSKPRKEQALIYYTCLCYSRQPKAVREKIDRLCVEAGGQYADALKDLLLHADQTGVEGIAMRNYCATTTLWNARLRFFNLW